MNYKISLIIPIHNVENYLEEGIQSILRQTFDLKEIQVIMVDDGSTDKSGEIADKYTKRYNNFEVIHLQKAHGIAGFARNEGLKVAKGDYLMFMDSDDFFDEKACELMYQEITKYDADMVTCNYQNVNEDGVKWENSVFDKNEFKSFRLLQLEEEYRQSFYVLCSSVCVKIFKREYIEKNNIKFLEGVPAEDAYFTFSTLLKSNNIRYLDDIVYYYRRRNLNGKGMSISWNCSRNYFERINKAYKEIYKLFEEAGRLDYYRYFYSKNLTYMLYKFTDSTQIPDEEKKEILKEMHWFYQKSEMLKVEPVQKSVKILVNKIVEENYNEAIDICKIIQEFRAYLPEEQRERMSKPKKILYQKI